MNPNYTKIVKEEIDKLLECGFIHKIEHTEWVSPIVIVPKKNGKVQVCVDGSMSGWYTFMGWKLFFNSLNSSLHSHNKR